MLKCLFLSKIAHMDRNMLHDISLKQFKEHFPESPSIGIGDDLYLMDARLTSSHQPLQHPCRFDGLMFMYCIKGHLRISLNLNDYDVKENMFFVYFPGNIIKVNEIVDTPQDEVRYLVLAMSRDFLNSLHIDTSKVFNDRMAVMNTPLISLDKSQIKIMSDHLYLINSIIKAEPPYCREMASVITSSLMYGVAGIWARKSMESERDVPSSRGRMIYEQFMKLVTEYHTTYRNVGFYADKLCLTPKYLSKLVKLASGRSAPEWIDEYVILEAKNLLKHSNISIKEIVFRLNFPNQSVFYKFFKARTGMTPSEYRNS